MSKLATCVAVAFVCVRHGDGSLSRRRGGGEKCESVPARPDAPSRKSNQNHLVLAPRLGFSPSSKGNSAALAAGRCRRFSILFGTGSLNEEEEEGKQERHDGVSDQPRPAQRDNATLAVARQFSQPKRLVALRLSGIGYWFSDLRGFLREL